MRTNREETRPRLRIAVVGTGIAGMAAAWLLATAHDVTVFEADRRLGGHCNTVSIDAGDGTVAVDTGFIVCNPDTYPNLLALFDHLGVATVPTEMSFAVSIGDGALEYSGGGLHGLFAQPVNLLRPRFWSMLRDLLRFYREAPGDMANNTLAGDQTLGEYLDAHGYGRAVREDHLYPMAGAIWSTPAGQVATFPARAFVAFCRNHGLLRVTGRPTWRTVSGGSQRYVARLLAPLAGRICAGTPVTAVRRFATGVDVTAGGMTSTFDHVVIGAHADQALAMLTDPDGDESRLLGRIHYGRNETVLHTDPRLMPRRRGVWSSWNYIAPSTDASGAGRATGPSRAEGRAARDAPSPTSVGLPPRDPAMGRTTSDPPPYERREERTPTSTPPSSSPTGGKALQIVNLDRGEYAPPSVTYWMNRLQRLPTRTNLFVTLNPPFEPHAAHILARMSYEHPILDAEAVAVQPLLWSLQGRRRTWFCGAWFGAGFHEYALQAGLAVAEQLGGVRRPWRVPDESGRIHVGPVPHVGSSG